MGCCNKRYDERPVGRVRYTAGLVMMAGVHGAFLAGLAVASPFVPRCRKILPGYWAFTVDVLRGVVRRDRILVGSRPPSPAVPDDPFCECASQDFFEQPGGET
jgi:hypothetical protein